MRLPPLGSTSCSVNYMLECSVFASNSEEINYQLLDATTALLWLSEKLLCS